MNKINPIVLSKIINLVNDPSTLEGKIRLFFEETDEFYILIKNYSNCYKNNTGDNLSLEIPMRIEYLYKTNARVKDFLIGIK